MKSISCAITTRQIRGRTKTVTRRLGWLDLKPGTLLRAVVKCMGLRKGERVQPLALLYVVSVRRERLDTITPDDVDAEGFPDMTPAEFVAMFCRSHKGCRPDSTVTRIEFRYVAGFDPSL